MLLFGWELPREHDLGLKALQMEAVILLAFEGEAKGQVLHGRLQ